MSTPAAGPRWILPALAALLAGLALPLALPAQSLFSRATSIRAAGTERAAVSAEPHPAVARIIGRDGNAISYGSGTLVAAAERHGVVITNWHVIDGMATVQVAFPDGFQSPAQVLKYDSDWDLAALLIERPAARPVPLARGAPRIGEPLTIAGYGSGSYRAVTGRVIQYVAPGADMPYEMVELSAQARQGDSGGPIFNAHGELAGVLFGASRGATAGSYAGRVQWFLDSLPADPGQRFGAPAAQHIARQPPSPRPDSAPAAGVGAAGERLPPVGSPPIQPALPVQPSWTAAAPPPAATSPSLERSTFVPLAPPTAPSWRDDPRGPGLTDASGADDQPWWQPLVGYTLFEQIKSLLAAIGALTIVVLLLRRA